MAKSPVLIALSLLLLFPSPVYSQQPEGVPLRIDGKIHGNLMEMSWEIDPRCILPRGPQNSFDSRVVGDPCIVFDEDLGTWRMFYFAAGFDPSTQTSGARTAMALSKSIEDIGPDGWTKMGPVTFTNAGDIMNPDNWHKWWVVMDAYRPNYAAKIEGDYWALYVTNVRLDEKKRPHKHIQVACSKELKGPWTIRKEPILTPDEEFLDGLHCDTPTAYWFAEKRKVMIVYKAYPSQPQSDQPHSLFGSSTVTAWWHPKDLKAQKANPVLRPGQTDYWNNGWISSCQIIHNAKDASWYGIINASPTPPEDESHREPAPSLGGWVVIQGTPPDHDWQTDTRFSPFVRPEDLTQAQLSAGLGVNFWRHHLLVTPGGQARIFFNSGPYGMEQMYSLVLEDH